MFLVEFEFPASKTISCAKEHFVLITLREEGLASYFICTLRTGRGGICFDQRNSYSATLSHISFCVSDIRQPSHPDVNLLGYIILCIKSGS